MTQIDIPRVKLGSRGYLEVSGLYNAPLSHEAGGAIIREAFDRDITFFDTADLYGHNFDNEIMVGKALKQLPREKIQVSTKFGVVKLEGDRYRQYGVKGRPEYVRECCEASLKRLQVDYIDIYHPHRIDVTVPIEDTGSNHPIIAVQMEYSIWVRDIEDEIVPVCRKLGIGIVAYSPLGRGFFGGKAVLERLPTESVLAILLWPHVFYGNLFFNCLNTYSTVVVAPCILRVTIVVSHVVYASQLLNLANLAEKHACTTPQLALALLLYQGKDIIPIPGTTKIKNLDNNVGSLTVKLSEDNLREICEAVPIDEDVGER
ncbi:hypothetical protein CIPAW_01G195000 [Carya illinoinensis]|uniref:NADP-dependent oxidoreductase domain-containing protein n=1 Tax=Carya illinoinensis TaxID=32201 RepID=A0A8T1RQ24_CARIL|nr:hypothetical protein CIPAW_01G195000 [Carya illinoinensis]